MVTNVYKRGKYLLFKKIEIFIYGVKVAFNSSQQTTVKTLSFGIGCLMDPPSASPLKVPEIQPCSVR